MFSLHLLVITVLLTQMSIYLFPLVAHALCVFRCYDNFYQDQFYLDLINSPVLSNLYEITDINLACKVFIDEFLGICDSHAPIKERRVKVRKNSWMTAEVIDLMFHRDSLRQKAIKHKDPTIWDQYIKIRNNVTKVIHKSKAFYFRKQITSNATKRNLHSTNLPILLKLAQTLLTAFSHL